MQQLQEAVLRANRLLVQSGLVKLTWGNVSAIDRTRGLVIIKPSGVAYDALTAADLAVLTLDGKQLSGKKPSSDTPTHLALYRAFPSLGGIAHTHSPMATVWAQAGRGIPPYGTTHADFAYGEIPCIPALSKAQVEGDYEAETGNAIAAYFQKKKLSPAGIPAALLHFHGAFCWGKNASAAAEAAITLEEIAAMAYHTEQLNTSRSFGGKSAKLPEHILQKHYTRKHGAGAYYGQED